MKTYTECVKTCKTYEERVAYLQCFQPVGIETFGGERYLQERILKSPRFKSARNAVILRDDGCDLGIPGRKIPDSKTCKRDDDRPTVHHINPITRQQALNDDPAIYDLDNLILTTKRTHKTIHYGAQKVKTEEWRPRSTGDTCPWKS